MNIKTRKIEGTNWEFEENSIGINTVRRKTMPYFIKKVEKRGPQIWQMGNRDYENIGGPIKIYGSTLKALRSYARNDQGNRLFFYDDGITLGGRPTSIFLQKKNEAYAKILGLLSGCEFLPPKENE